MGLGPSARTYAVGRHTPLYDLYLPALACMRACVHVWFHDRKRSAKFHSEAGRVRLERSWNVRWEHSAACSTERDRLFDSMFDGMSNGALNGLFDAMFDGVFDGVFIY